MSPKPDESLVVTEHPGPGVTLLRLNRPNARNALNLALRRELAGIFTRLADEPETRCVVITGNEHAFAAGADVKEMADAGAIEFLQRGVHRLLKPIADFPKPLIAAVSGYALGGGCELAMHADIIVAGEGATFGLPEVKLGVMPGGGGTQRLVRAVGKFKALRLLLTGELLPAREAYAMNLVSEIVPDDAVLSRALSLAGQIASLAPLALAQIKEAVLGGQDASLDTALALERKGLQILFASSDQKEGMRAFLEKRTPRFEGR